MHELYTVLAEYYDTIYKSRAERVKEEIDFVEEIFREDAKREVKRVLDLACGTGIPTLELAERGYEVLGLDLHEEMLRVARRKAEARGLNVKFIRGNALDISFEEEFDAVTMFFSSIMYFDDSAIRELFNSVRRTLRPGGVFIADFPCWFYGGNDGPIVWDERRGDERLVITDWREVEPAVQKLRFKRLVQIIMPNGETKAFFVDDELNIYTPREMRLLAEQYFSEVKIYGNLRRDIAPSDRRYWLVAVK
ncbi:SAM-dependent methyltransferase, UbiE/COQ5 family [Thermococcus kodakarensis KOD1]|uniref:SAM-dependent methyltransferase, UbiE/COQ5 family n=1 Tax=Thermococcus kodakarensis (strain ATCC BAA-918 / JCM 12380 / KOD1) TaxID=69014 RepID=Q5JGN8_THEKO|nr:class I SAM-dependent methyltransferase [Thermococcus kodakarensis]WCN29314.1 class I SAM-dependent methyltransferase [Thermococcus kodakarensis]WCN31610.1 class I SAM-dependent methyltransferase [Thermococcus kodakarensis]BAD85462.1 SAM-dependent methyltransferase, UbiE/COQ5 family [Thermococcus kodakarensis KOD1]